MSLEELWELFPIFLVKPDENWELYYEEMEALLKELLKDQPIKRISHIGSTAIRDIWAKNIVDVLVEIKEDGDMKKIAQILAGHGFTVMSEDEKHISLNKGYGEEGFEEKVYHIHLRYAGDNDELYFRDYLNDHPDIAKEYETLKLKLWKSYEHDRNGYTEAKTDFISHYTKLAKKEYGGRYKS